MHMYKPYADAEYYRTIYYGSVIPEEELDKALTKASRHIDTLTFNRIVKQGIESIPGFSQDVIMQVCCELADFEYENADLIQSVLSSYSINGVSMNFGQSFNMLVQDGVCIRREQYSLLSQTGLCCRSLGV